MTETITPHSISEINHEAIFSGSPNLDPIAQMPRAPLEIEMSGVPLELSSVQSMQHGVQDTLSKSNNEQGNSSLSVLRRTARFAGRILKKVAGEPNNIDGSTNIKIDPVVPMPIFYTEYGKERREGLSPLRGALETLRAELLFNTGVGNGSALESAYKLSRNIADVYLSQLAGKRGQFGYMAILDAGQYDSQTKNFYMINNVGGYKPTEAKNLPEEPWGAFASHAEHDRYIVMDTPTLLEASSDFRDAMKSAGLSFKNPSDHQLITFLEASGHETGHNILAHASNILRARRKEEVDAAENKKIGTSSNLATKTILAKNPEKALTGNWETDVASHEERFAQGYGMVVLSRILVELGYSEVEQAAIGSYFLDRSSDSIERAGQSDIDMLGDVDEASNLAQAAQAKGLTMSNSMLGYSMPLTPDEIVDQIDSIHTEVVGLVNNPAKDLHMDAPEDWSKTAGEGRRDLDTQAAIDRRIRLRKQAIKYQARQQTRPKSAARVIRRVDRQLAAHYDKNWR